jgi:D-glycero-beta-D-manno-heptose 1-phosphate adenylyltransferase
MVDFDVEWRALEGALETYRRAGKRIVTTNGCFDGLHAGHVTLLEEAKRLGDVLIVGINSDASVKRLKGSDRPKMIAADRARLLGALKPVDHVVIFDDDLPLGFLERVRPAVHVKGGDYDAEQMPESALVKKNGGEVRIIPLVEGRSSSIAMIGNSGESTPARALLLECLRWSNVVRQTGYLLAETIAAEGTRMHGALVQGQKILVAGNGGSAADADHFAAELIGRYRRKRDGVPVISMVGGPGVITSLANDHGYAEIFRLQLIAMAKPGDIFLSITTSGKSENLLRAMKEAKGRGVSNVLLTGRTGGPARELADVLLPIPSDDTVEIQQGHRAVIHALCERIDALLAKEAS